MKTNRTSFRVIGCASLMRRCDVFYFWLILNGKLLIHEFMALNQRRKWICLDLGCETDDLLVNKVSLILYYWLGCKSNE